MQVGDLPPSKRKVAQGQSISLRRPPVALENKEGKVITKSPEAKFTPRCQMKALSNSQFAMMNVPSKYT